MGLENFSNGGPIMVPLAVCSILVLALLLERILALRKNLIVPNEQIKTIDHFLEKPDLQGLKDWSSDDKTPLKEACTILLTVSKNPENKRIECVQRLEENNQVPDLGKFIISGATGGVGNFAIDIMSTLCLTLL